MLKNHLDGGLSWSLNKKLPFKIPTIHFHQAACLTPHRSEGRNFSSGNPGSGSLVCFEMIVFWQQKTTRSKSRSGFVVDGLYSKKHNQLVPIFFPHLMVSLNCYYVRLCILSVLPFFDAPPTGDPRTWLTRIIWHSRFFGPIESVKKDLPPPRFNIDDVDTKNDDSKHVSPFKHRYFGYPC